MAEEAKPDVVWALVIATEKEGVTATEQEGVTATKPKKVSRFFVLYYAIDLRKASPELQSQCAELYGADAGEQTGNKKGDLQRCYDAFVDKYYKQEVDGKVRKSYEKAMLEAKVVKQQQLLK